MKTHKTAYDYNADPTLSLVKKCAKCNFKAVKEQFLDSNGCPCCKNKE